MGSRRTLPVGTGHHLSHGRVASSAITVQLRRPPHGSRPKYFRTAMIESQYFRGTTFSIDVDQREYWITAKHILTGAEHPPFGTVDTSKPVSLKILDPGANQERWVTVPFSVIDGGKDV